MLKYNKVFMAAPSGGGGGFDFSQLMSMFGNLGGGNQGGGMMQGANLTLMALNQMAPDYKLSSGNQYLSLLQSTRKGSGNQIFDTVGQAVDSTVQIIDMIDKMSHEKDNRSLEEIAGIYANGGNLFAGGGFNPQGMGDAMLTAVGLFGNAQALAQIKDTSTLGSSIANNYVQGHSAGMSFDDVANQYSNLRFMNHVSASDLRPNSWTSDVLNGISAGNQGAQAGMSVGGPWGAAIGGVVGTASSVIGSLLGRSKAQREADRANKHIDWLNDYNDRTLRNNAGNVGKEQLNKALAGVFALGGPLESNGTIFDNGLSFINEGGSHEQNPNDGIQVGVDLQGVPNLVEEGEVIWKDLDYVFSKRLKTNKSLVDKFKLPSQIAGKSFADAAKLLSKESEERPTDAISKRGKDAMLTRLMDYQEDVRLKKEARKAKKDYESLSPQLQEDMMMQASAELEMQNTQEQMLLTQEQQAAAQMMGAPQFACGGRMGNKFGGPGEKTLFLLNYDSPEYAKAVAQAGSTMPTQEDLAAAMAMIDLFKKDNPLNYNKNTMLDNVTVEGTLKTKRPTIETAKVPWATPVEKLSSKNMPKTPQDTRRYIDRKDNALANSLRMASLIPGLYGLSNPPSQGSMAAERARDVYFNPSGVQLDLKPWDYNFVANQIMAGNNAAARAILNNSANRGQAMAGILANNYNLNEALGKAYTQGYEFNNGIREKMANFYNQRDLSNAQAMMQAAAHNQAADAAYNQRAMAAAEYNQNERDKVYATKMANLENLFGNLSNIGEDMLNRDDAEFTARAQREAITNSKKCNGGKIRKRR